jgi:hypothetical protein
MLPVIIIGSVAIGVAALVGFVALSLRPSSENTAEDRLAVLTGKKKVGKDAEAEATLLTANTLDDTKTLADQVLANGIAARRPELWDGQAGTRVAAAITAFDDNQIALDLRPREVGTPAGMSVAGSDVGAARL